MHLIVIEARLCIQCFDIVFLLYNHVLLSLCSKVSLNIFDKPCATCDEWNNVAAKL